MVSQTQKTVPNVSYWRHHGHSLQFVTSGLGWYLLVTPVTVKSVTGRHFAGASTRKSRRVFRRQMQRG
jgi:hypothetical protein